MWGKAHLRILCFIRTKTVLRNKKIIFFCTHPQYMYMEGGLKELPPNCVLR